MDSPKEVPSPTCEVSETSAEKQEGKDDIDDITMNDDNGAGESSADGLVMESDGEFLEGFQKELDSLEISLKSDSFLTLSPEGDFKVVMSTAEKRRLKKTRKQERKALEESKASLTSSAETDQKLSPAKPGESNSAKDQTDSELQKAQELKKSKNSDSKKVTSESDSKKEENFLEANKSDKQSYSDSKKVTGESDSKNNKKTLTTKPVKNQNSDSVKANKQERKKDEGSRQAPKQSENNSNSDSKKASRKFDSKKDEKSLKTKSSEMENSDSEKASSKHEQRKDGKSKQMENLTPKTAPGKDGSGKNSKAKLMPNVGKKRKHNSPTTNHQPAKKQAGSWSFSDATKADLIVIIRRVGSGFSESHIKELRAKLCERLDATPLGATRPTFESNRLINGAFQLEAANQFSKDWLLKLITEIDSLDGVKLWVTTAEREASRQRITMTMQDSQSVSSDIIYRRFREANTGLKTDEWVLIKTLAEGPRNRTIMLSVDKESADFMIARNKKLYYMLQRVHVDIRARKIDGQPAEIPMDS